MSKQVSNGVKTRKRSCHSNDHNITPKFHVELLCFQTLMIFHTFTRYFRCAMFLSNLPTYLVSFPCFQQ